ncbi:hypothetical protein AB4Y43_01040 [Paraburkholderia sp. BR10872]|uniref:hypothetical protein n=1 Tax=Paraburkholderia sp. BR10872 TaxID=3236989 RepID=UPI0034D1B254
MSTREQFEAWWLKDVPEEHRAFAKKLLDGYGPDYVHAAGVADAWTAWQASRAVALEDATKACDRIAADYWNLYKGHLPYTGLEGGRADPAIEGKSDSAEECANAILALAKAEGGNNG